MEIYILLLAQLLLILLDKLEMLIWDMEVP